MPRGVFSEAGKLARAEANRRMAKRLQREHQAEIKRLAASPKQKVLGNLTRAEVREALLEIKRLKYKWTNSTRVSLSNTGRGLKKDVDAS
jgi:hypothetical protein